MSEAQDNGRIEEIERLAAALAASEVRVSELEEDKARDWRLETPLRCVGGVDSPHEPIRWEAGPCPLCTAEAQRREAEERAAWVATYADNLNGWARENRFPEITARRLDPGEITASINRLGVALGTAQADLAAARKRIEELEGLLRKVSRPGYVAGWREEVRAFLARFDAASGGRK